MNNPYTAPAADLSVAGSDAGTYEPRAWSLSGRIGRVRYIAYSYWLGVALVFVLSLVFGFAAAVSPRLMAFQALAYLPWVAVLFVMAVRRLQDMDHAGWWSVLFLVPGINLLFVLWLMVWPGDKTANQYGQPPSPNTLLLTIGGAALPIIFMIGIFTAIAIPEYMRYKLSTSVLSAPR